MPALKNLRSNESEISGIGTGFGAAFPPINETDGVLRIPRHSKRIDEGGGENRLFKAVSTAFSVERGENEPDGAEVVIGLAVGIEKFPEFGALFGGSSGFLNPGEEADQDAEFGFPR